MRELAQQIERVDARGAEGIDIRVDLEDSTEEFAALAAKVRAFERTHSIDLGVDTRGAAGAFGTAAAARGAGSAPPMPIDVGGIDFPEGSADLIAGTFGRRGPSPSLRAVRRFTYRIRGAAGRLGTFDLRMSEIHNLLATLVPLLLTFIGAIPVAITAMVTLAAAAVSAAAALFALGALGALGAATAGGQMPAGEDFMEFFETIRDEMFEAFAPLGERLEPLFLDAIDGLERFFQRVANQGDALVALTDDARGFGEFITDFVPVLLRNMAALVEAMGPILGRIGTFFERNLTEIIREMVRVTMQAMPTLTALTSLIMDATAVLIEMSVGFAEAALVVSEVIGLMFRLLNMIGLNNQTIGLLTGSVLAFASALAIANFVMKTWAYETMASAVRSTYAFFLALLKADSAMAFLAGTTLVSAITSLFGFIKALIAGDVALKSFTISSFSAAGALAAFLTLASLGVLAGLTALALSAAANFFNLADSINQATNSMRDFNRVAGVASNAPSFSANTSSDFDDDDDGGSGGGPPTGGGGGGVSITIESSGDEDQDKSNVKRAGWRNARTTGDRP